MQQPFVFRGLELAGVVMTPHLSGVASDDDGVILRNIYTERDERRDGVGLVVAAGYRDGVAELRASSRSCCSAGGQTAIMRP